MENVSMVRVREKGQITLPVKLRDALQFKNGSELIAIVSGNELVLIPKIKNPLEKFGMLGREKGVRRVKELLWEYERY